MVPELVSPCRCSDGTTGSLDLMTRNKSLFTLFVLSCLLMLASSCASSRDIPVPGQTVDVACGRCIFGMEEALGCPWAAEIDGKHYLMLGELPEGHMNHSPAGICNVRRQARVEGFIRQDRFVSTSIELFDAKNVPDQPTYTEKDLH